ncbi:hypothetical protein [Pseudalkalibacillus berkeleyi]|uniref:Uncharacterized protein n=1 Tax=Pseudalkalibacillus berkeleyi TaxID=1069813 RepID=A0ABS9H6Z4_9BACL|nr:hypothetical protein [Pseudalkalibacillus berkeleyi]MCF6139565.1 hypothetical protein [Pseudalkalibacillus berkeleyi]
MSIKLTSELNKQIRTHKRFLESYDLFNYGFKWKGEMFYYVTYSLLGRVKGMAVLYDGSPIENEGIIEAFSNIYNFNRIINVARDQLFPDMKKPVDVLEQLKNLLIDVKGASDVETDEINEEVETVVQTLDEVIGFPWKLNDILVEMKSIEKDVLDRGYLLSEEVDRMMELNISHNQIMYEQGRKQLSITDHVARIRDHLENEPYQNFDKYLKDLLNLYLEKKTVNQLRISQQSFEIVIGGKSVPYSAGERGMKELEENIRAEVKQIIDKDMKEKLRNKKH